MSEADFAQSELLSQARIRGREAFGCVLPAGLDNLTTYVGLIGSALELGKLIQTEARDLAAIDTYYKIEIARMDSAFREVEIAMVADFKRDASLREKSFESINLLIAAGQHEIALKLYELLVGGFARGALESLIQLRNNATLETTSRITLK
jgi:hypothetical protein